MVEHGARALVAGAAAGDRAAWDALVDRYASLLWSVARAHRLSEHDAADVVQTTWLRLLDNLDRIEDPDRIAGWLATTARRECLHTIRRSRREPALDVIDLLTPVAGGTAPDAAVLRGERDVALWELFDRLSDTCRRLLRVLIADPAPSYAQVAEALDMAVGSIGPTRQRCLAALREQAQDAGIAMDGG